MAEKWWANMSNYDEAKQKTHQKNWAKAGVYCHTFMPTGKEGPMFQNFIDGPDVIGVHMGLDQPLHNHFLKIDHELIGGDGPYPRHF